MFEILTNVMAVSGVHSEEFVIHKYIFDHYYDVNSFKIDLRATANFGGSNSTGLAYMFLERNSPPKHGNCIISPTFGYAAQTKFDIQCSNFSDDDVEDSVANYQIKCKVALFPDCVLGFFTLAYGHFNYHEYVILIIFNCL